MSNPTDDEQNQDQAEVVRTLESVLLSHNIIFTTIEYAEDLKTCLVFVSTRNISAVDIPPLEQVAVEVNAVLRAVVDSNKDKLCFFFVYSNKYNSHSWSRLA
jgi:hypothetical protein